MAHLFSYGTLQQEEVQIILFNRTLSGKPDVLPGFKVGHIKIEDPQVITTSGSSLHPILQFTGEVHDEIAGTQYELSEKELAQADNYEISAYARTFVRLKSGLSAFIYVDARELNRINHSLGEHQAT